MCDKGFVSGGATDFQRLEICGSLISEHLCVAQSYQLVPTFSSLQRLLVASSLPSIL